MELPDKYKERLGRLECHFKWHPKSAEGHKSIEGIMKKVESHLELYPHLSHMALALMSYLYTLHSKRFSIKAALETIDRALAMESDPSHIKCEFVLRVDQLHIKYKHKNVDDEELLSQLEAEWAKRESYPQWEAAVWGTKGLAMSRFGPSMCKEGIDDFQKAIDLDPQNSIWYFGKGRLIARKRRLDTTLAIKPTDEEIQLLKQAYTHEQKDTNKAFYASFYSKALSEHGPKYKQECLDLNIMAMKFAADDQLLYWNCAKVYKRFWNFPDHKQCLLKGIESCKIKDKLYHGLGAFYKGNRREKDLDKSKEYLKKAMESYDCGEGYFWVEMELLQVERELNSPVDFEEEYGKIGAKYEGDPVYMKSFHQLYGIHLLQTGNNEWALKEFLEAVALEIHTTFGQVFLIRNQVENLLLKTFQKQGRVQDMINLAWFFKELRPESKQNYHKSSKWYECILIKDPTNEIIRPNLGSVLLKLEKYNTAVRILDQICTQAFEDKEALCNALLKLAEQSEMHDVKEKHFRRCMEEFHCKNGAVGLLQILKTKAENNPGIQLSRPFYDDCAAISETVSDLDSFSLDTDPPILDLKKIVENIRALLGMEGSLETLRQYRYEMSCAPESKVKIEQVLCEARFQLDRIQKQFGKHHFPKGKPYCCFPLAVKTVMTDHVKVKKELSRLIQSPKESHGGWTNFPHKFELLLDFLAEKQVASHQWLKVWFDLINIHKHERELGLDDYQIPTLKAIGNPNNPEPFKPELDEPKPYEPEQLAHMAAEFTEQVVAEYQKYM